jgi:hypothetical protein
MKQNLLFSITLAIAFALMPKPFSFTIAAMDPARGTVKAVLEKSTATLPKGKSSGAVTYTIPNAKSPVRVKIGDAVFQSSLDNINSFLTPPDYITLYKLSTGNKSRSFTEGSALIPLNFIPGDVRERTKITPAQALIPGEYAFVDKSTTAPDGSVIVWTFGIDN